MPGKLEAKIEKQVRRWVESEGGKWIKLLADGRKGIPDNLIILPHISIERFDFPVCFMVELKRGHGGILSPHQERWLHDLSILCFPVFVCYSLEHVQEIADHVKQSIRRRVLGPKADLR
jgi:hypothetical protein